MEKKKLPFKHTYTHTQIALGYTITRQAISDNLYRLMHSSAPWEETKSDQSDLDYYKAITGDET